VPSDLSLPPEVEALLFRASQEAIRNVVSHAGAHRLELHVAADDGAAVLQVVDDGRGFSADRQTDAVADNHVGLQLLSDLARDANGTFDVTTASGEGTRIRLRVPIR
jgi:two-component system NarL family sensor kinase